MNNKEAAYAKKMAFQQHSLQVRKMRGPKTKLMKYIVQILQIVVDVTKQE